MTYVWFCETFGWKFSNTKVRGQVAKKKSECKFLKEIYAMWLSYILSVWFQVNNWALTLNSICKSNIKKHWLLRLLFECENQLTERGSLSGLGISSTRTVNKYIITITRRLHVDIYVGSITISKRSRARFRVLKCKDFLHNNPPVVLFWLRRVWFTKRDFVNFGFR